MARLASPRTPRLGCLGLDSGDAVLSCRRSPLVSASASGASLDLTGNGITCLVREVLAQQPEARMVNLRTLLCTGNDLQRLDPIICRSLQKLELLCLSGNRIHTLPADICQLRSLKMLRLESNALSALPWQIGELQQMEQLWLACNELAALPESIGSLRRLRELWLVGNQLECLPQSLGELVRLERLEVSENLLSTLPESTSRLVRLQELWLRGNRLAEVPDCLSAGLPSLVLLDLSSNRLSSVPPTLASCATLTTLRLEANPELDFPSPTILAAGSAAVLAGLRRLLEARLGSRGPVEAALGQRQGRPADGAEAEAEAAAWVDTGTWESWVAEDSEAAEHLRRQCGLQLAARDDEAEAEAHQEPPSEQGAPGERPKSPLEGWHRLSEAAPRAQPLLEPRPAASPAAAGTLSGGRGGSRAAARRSDQHCSTAYYDRLITTANLGRGATAGHRAAPSLASTYIDLDGTAAFVGGVQPAHGGARDGGRSDGGGSGGGDSGPAASPCCTPMSARLDAHRRNGYHMIGGAEAVQAAGGAVSSGGGLLTSPLRTLEAQSSPVPSPSPSSAPSPLHLEAAPPMSSLLQSFVPLLQATPPPRAASPRTAATGVTTDSAPPSPRSVTLTRSSPPQDEYHTPPLEKSPRAKPEAQLEHNLLATCGRF